MAVIAHDPSMPTQTHAEVTRDVVRTITEKPTRGYYILAGTMAFLTLVLFGTLGALLKYGLGLAGYSPPVMWSVYITTFVFWVGIGHAGTLISAILFLFRSPLAHRGVPLHRSDDGVRRHDGGALPDHSHRAPVALLLAAALSQPALPLAQLQVAADLGRVRDLDLPHRVVDLPGHRPGAGHRRGARSRERLEEEALRAALSLGWTGADSQWRHYTRAYLYLAALATPLVLSVHSVVSWDFAMSIVPGWHGTIFAPYFVAGAIYSGVGMVLTLIIPLRKVLKHRAHDHRLPLRQPRQADAAHRVDPLLRLRDGVLHRLVLAATPFEQTTFWRRAFGPNWWAGWTMIICNAFVSQLLWFKKIRTNLTALFVISIFINIGMWFERCVIIVDRR